MEFSTPLILLICSLFFLVAFLYSSVGHGGASGYLAVLSLFTVSPHELSSTALVLNVLVAGLAFLAYYRTGHFSARLVMPFLATSMPLAFVGGMLHVTTTTYSLLLAGALLFAAFRLIVKFEPSPQTTPKERKPPNIITAFIIGGIVGSISGIVGVGGGIFLSPLILLMDWGDVKQTAATSAGFIVLNSIAGIIGRIVQSTFAWGGVIPFLIAAGLGGYIGSHFGSNRFTTLTLRRILGIVLIIAAVKLIISNL